MSRYSCGPSSWEVEGKENVQRCGAASWGRQHRAALRSHRSGSGLSSHKPRNDFFLLWGFKIQLCDTSVLFQIADPEACDQMYESLVRIHTNYYKNKVSVGVSRRPSPSAVTALGPAASGGMSDRQMCGRVAQQCLVPLVTWGHIRTARVVVYAVDERNS